MHKDKILQCINKTLMTTGSVDGHIKFQSFPPSQSFFIVRLSFVSSSNLTSCLELIKTSDSCRATSITDPCWCGLVSLQSC